MCFRVSFFSRKNVTIFCWIKVVVLQCFPPKQKKDAELTEFGLLLEGVLFAGGVVQSGFDV